jgi:CMP-N-acetylneuraminic acid synthetase
VTVIAVVPARSGSKGFPNKNMARLGGRSLLELAIQVGKDSRLVNDVYVSTDSQEYAEVAAKAGARIAGLRPVALGGDSVKTSTVVVDLLRQLKIDDGIVVLLQPTSPIRTPDDVDNVVRILERENIDAVATVELLDEPHPEKVKRRNADGMLESYIPGVSSETPRQRLPEAYRLNGAIYAIRTSVLLEQETFLPPRTFGHPIGRGVNVDREEDFILLKALFEMGRVALYGARAH